MFRVRDRPSLPEVSLLTTHYLGWYLCLDRKVMRVCLRLCVFVIMYAMCYSDWNGGSNDL